MPESPLIVLDAAVAWPIVVIVLAVLFRQSITRSLGRLRSFKYREFSAILDQAMDLSSLVLDTSEEGRIQSLEAQRPMIEIVARLARSEDHVPVLQRLDAMAREFDHLRAALPSSEDRTQRLDLIAARMRLLSPISSQHVDSFRDDDSPGRRLIALSALQVSPNARHMSWLFDSAHDPSGFTQFHVLLAMRSALRVLPRHEHHLTQFKALRPIFDRLNESQARFKLYKAMWKEFCGAWSEHPHALAA